VSALIGNHYKDNRGKLEFWGRIKHYIFHNGFGEILIFDTNGNLLNESENRITESSYRVLVKGKSIF